MKTKGARFILNIIIPIMIFMLMMILIAATPSGILEIKNWKDTVLLIIQTLTIVIFIRMLATIMVSINSSEEYIFTQNNVKRFNRLGYMFLALILFDYINCVITGEVSAGALIDCGSFFVISGTMCILMIPCLLCFLIADSFQKAINIKEENDLTI